MIPMLATVNISHPRGRIRLWAPLFLLWLLLLPLAILALPLIAVAGLVTGFNPIRFLIGVGGVLSASVGTCIDVQAPGAQVLVRIL